jgi:hypothetical protein
MRAGEAAAIVLALVGLAAPGSDRFIRGFEVEKGGEVRAVVHAGCARCDWREPGREAVALRLSVDGAYSQHVMLARGETPADYPVTLGSLAAGTHRLTIERDKELSASGAGAASIDVPTVDVLVSGIGDDFTAQSMAPVLYARPNTVGRFTDLPILMWYEIVPTARGRQFRYSVIFTNEDGGTRTDRLMATWGRTTDIEFVYGVEVDAGGKIVAEEIQAAGHEVPPFTGGHEGAHPLLHVTTDNNMVGESGPSSVRYAPAPERFSLEGVSREAVMDRHPWSYSLMAKEMAREGKVDDGAAPGSGRIPDLRRYVFVEGCSPLQNAGIAFSVRARDGNGTRWFDSDRGIAEFRIARSGCFRGAVPLPASAGRPDAIRFSTRTGSPEAIRFNAAFMLDDQYLPGPALALQRQ